MTSITTNKNYELGAFYLYDVKAKPPKSRFPFVDYIKRKLQVGQPTAEDKRRSIVQKSGHYRIKYSGLKNQRAKYLRDLYVTLIDLQWRYVIAILFNACLVSYFVFAIMWYWLMSNHGDFKHLHDKNHVPCIHGVESFGGAILFSIETQTSIGYGYTYINAKCSGAVILLFVQVVVGILMENLLLGFIFAKFAQPKRRQKTLLFSKTAVVNQEDGGMVLQIRIGDMRQSHLLDARVHGVLIKKHVTQEGVVYPLYLHDVEFKAQGMDDKIVLMWPLVLTHKIDKHSPLWKTKPSDTKSERYELVVYIEGTIESTGEFCQGRTSYIPQEILWGHRFDRIEEFDAGNGRWEIDFEGFHDIVYVSNMCHSAYELECMKTKDDSAEVSERGPQGGGKKEPVAPSTSSITYDAPMSREEEAIPRTSADNRSLHSWEKDEDKVPLKKSFFDPKDTNKLVTEDTDVIHHSSPAVIEEIDLGDGEFNRNEGQPPKTRIQDTDEDEEYVST